MAALLVVLLPVVPACGPDAALRDEVAKLAADAVARSKRVDDLERAQERASRQMASLEHEVDALRTRQLAPVPGSEPTVTAEAPESDVADAPAEDVPAAEVSDTVHTLRELLPNALSGGLEGAEQQRFWSLLREDGAADELVAAAEAAVEASPGDLEARMALANAYVAKLFTVPPGPEMGVWGGKAESQWKAVLEADPEHWDARFSLAESWSHYPEQLNKTPDAIREFETLADRQETRAVEPRQARVYVQLSVLYRRQGRDDDARAVLERGLRRHPDDAGLRKALDALGEEEAL